MVDFRTKVIVGNIVLHPDTIREYLAKSTYLLYYDPQTEKLVFQANSGDGAETLFEVRNVSYESAVKLAERLGLKNSGTIGYEDLSTAWSKSNPMIRLYDDGSKESERLQIEMWKFGIPFTIFPNSKNLGISTSGIGIKMSPLWTAEDMLKSIREEAENYKEALSSKP